MKGTLSKKVMAVLVGAALMMLLTAGTGWATYYAYDFASGSLKGGPSSPYIANIGIAGMSGFKFNFNSGDRHIRYISTGLISDMVTAVEHNPWIDYRDNSGDDYYGWELARRALPFGTIRQVASGFTYPSRPYPEGNASTLALPGAWDNYEPVLLGFRFEYFNTDHHLDRIYLELVKNPDGSGILKHNFNDNLNSPYAWQITYALVPKYLVRSGLTAFGSSYGYDVDYSINVVNPVLQGFAMDFKNGDHHVDEIGVNLAQGTMLVWFNDTNDDDPFDWWVKYVDLP